MTAEYPQFHVDTPLLRPTAEQQAKFIDVMAAWAAACHRHVGRPGPLDNDTFEALGLILQQMCLDTVFWRAMRDITIKHDPLEAP